MTPEDAVLYLKTAKNTVVKTRTVRLGDIAEGTGIGAERWNALRDLEIYCFDSSSARNSVRVISILSLICRIRSVDPALQIVNLGESDFVVRYLPDPDRKWQQYCKVVLLCVILFLGSAFSIMTFIQDAAVAEVFDRFYFRVTGSEAPGFSLLDISFSIGLAVGILMFYNHIGKRKLTVDPTPIQVAMLKYEQDMDLAFVNSSNRKGKTIDTSGRQKEG